MKVVIKKNEGHTGFGKPLVNCARNCRGLTYIETLSFDLILASDLENYEIKLTSCV